MDRKETVHYHIRWAQIPLLDWESFMTRVEAEAAAKILARRGEAYTVEEHGEAASDAGMPGERNSRPLGRNRYGKAQYSS
jgi:hypothetical protein